MACFIQITGAFLMFPTTFEIPVVLGRSNSYSSETRSKRRRHQRSVPRHPGLCSEELETSAGVTGGMCRLMTSVLSSVVTLIPAHIISLNHAHVRTVWRWPGARSPSSRSPPPSPPWPAWSGHSCPPRWSLGKTQKPRNRGGK